MMIIFKNITSVHGQSKKKKKLLQYTDVNNARFKWKNPFFPFV